MLVTQEALCCAEKVAPWAAYRVQLLVKTKYNVSSLNDFNANESKQRPESLTSSIALLLMGRLHLDMMQNNNSDKTAICVLELDSIQLPVEFSFAIAALKKPLCIRFREHGQILSIVFAKEVPVESRQIITHLLSYIQVPNLKNKIQQGQEQDRNGIFNALYKQNLKGQWIKSSLGYIPNPNSSFTSFEHNLCSTINVNNVGDMQSVQLFEKVITFLNKKITAYTESYFNCELLSDDKATKPEIFDHFTLKEFSKDTFALSNCISEKELETHLFENTLKKENYSELKQKLLGNKNGFSHADSFHLYESFAALFYLHENTVDSATGLLQNTERESFEHRTIIKALCKASTNKSLALTGKLLIENLNEPGYTYFIYQQLVFTKHPSVDMLQLIDSLVFVDLWSPSATTIRFLFSSLIGGIRKRDVNLANKYAEKLLSNPYFKTNTDELIKIIGNIGLEETLPKIDSLLNMHSGADRAKIFSALRNTRSDQIFQRLVIELKNSDNYLAQAGILFSLQYQLINEKNLNSLLSSYEFVNTEADRVSFLKILMNTRIKNSAIDTFIKKILLNNKSKAIEEAIANKSSHN